MKRIQLEVELTDKQCEFLKNLTLSSEKKFTYIVDDYDMYNDLVNKGIVVEWTDSWGSESGRFLSEIGYKIKQLMN